MTLRERRPSQPITDREQTALMLFTAFVLILLAVVFLGPLIRRATDIPNCPVTLNVDGTWTPRGWTVEDNGALWCELNPDIRPGAPVLRWDYTWEVQQ